METTTLKDRLAKIDPATLKAGTETDALVAECLGWSALKEKAVHEFQAADRRGLPWDARLEDGSPRQHNQRVWIKDGKLIACEKCGILPCWSTDDGLAFEVLWPWLLERKPWLSLNLDPGGDSNKPTVMDIEFKEYRDWKLIGRADTWALALCRTVVAVAKCRKKEYYHRCEKRFGNPPVIGTFEPTIGDMGRDCDARNSPVRVYTAAGRWYPYFEVLPRMGAK